MANGLPNPAPTNPEGLSKIWVSRICKLSSVSVKLNGMGIVMFEFPIHDKVQVFPESGFSSLDFESETEPGKTRPSPRLRLGISSRVSNPSVKKVQRWPDSKLETSKELDSSLILSSSTITLFTKLHLFRKF